MSRARRHAVERNLLAGLLGGAAVMHALQPRFFEGLVPAWAPGTPRFWNVASGIAEAGAAAALLHPRTRRAGGAVAAITLAGVYPANVQAALDGGTPGLRGFAGSPTAAWLRLPLQAPPLWVAVRVAAGRDAPAALDTPPVGDAT